jgi:hypothetical protein
MESKASALNMESKASALDMESKASALDMESKALALDMDMRNPIFLKNRISCLNKSVGQVLGKQLLRSGTSIGANVHEAQGAQSKADFIAKMSIAHRL